MLTVQTFRPRCDRFQLLEKTDQNLCVMTKRVISRKRRCLSSITEVRLPGKQRVRGSNDLHKFGRTKNVDVKNIEKLIAGVRARAKVYVRKRET